MKKTFCDNCKKEIIEDCVTIQFQYFDVIEMENFQLHYHINETCLNETIIKSDLINELDRLIHKDGNDMIEMTIENRLDED